jgi:ornithine--oxo-acid transaminase
MFCVDHENVKPDLLIMGKALSGGLYPVSAVTSIRGVLDLFTPGTHGSTYGGNPLACAIADAALDVITEEKLPARSARLGAYFLSRLSELKHPLIKELRGRGLLIALEFKKPVAKTLCHELMLMGLLAKDTHGTTVRFAPPLVITKKQLDKAFLIIHGALKKLPNN